MINERLQIGYLEVQNRPTVNGTGVLLQGEAAGGSVENVVFTTGDQTISGIKTFYSQLSHFGMGLNGTVSISDDSISGELGLITDNDEVIAAKMNDGSFQYGGGQPSYNGPLSILNGNISIYNTGTTNTYDNPFLTINNGINKIRFAIPPQEASESPELDDAAFILRGDAGNVYSLEFLNGAAIGNGKITFNQTGNVAYKQDISKIIDKFTPSQNQPPSTGFAQFDTRNSILVLDFDDTLTESGTFVGSIPDTANISNGLNVRINWSAVSGTSGSCVWGARFMNLNTDLDIDSFDVAGFGSGVANATNGVPTVTQITCTGINGLTTGSFYRMLVFRNSADTVNDTMLGDAEINFIEVRAV
jgi:hypothetical protein